MLWAELREATADELLIALLHITEDKRIFVKELLDAPHHSGMID